MMKRILAALAVASAPMAAANAEPSQTGEAQLAEHRALADYVTRVAGALEQANQATDAFDEFSTSIDPNRDMRQQLPALRRARDRAVVARQIMADVARELAAIPEFNTEGVSAEYLALGNTLRTDSIAYTRNMDDLMAAMIETVDAVERNDRAGLTRSADRILRSASVLLDGQIVMLRARQQTTPQDASAYHSLGAMVAMYEGMRAIAMPEISNRADAIEAAARRAADFGRTGRAALAAERQATGALAPRDQALVRAMLDLEERFFVENDRLVAMLESAAGEARAGAGADVLNRSYTPQMTQVERTYQQLTQQQIALYSQMTR